MSDQKTADAIIKKYRPLARAEGNEVELTFGFGTLKLQVVRSERETSGVAAIQFAELFNRVVSGATQTGSLMTDESLSVTVDGACVIIDSQACGKVVLKVVHAHSSTPRRIALLAMEAIKVATQHLKKGTSI